MEGKKHKRKTNHVVIVTSDAADANVKQFRIKPWVWQTAVIILSMILGCFIGFFFYEEKIWEIANAKSTELLASMTQLEEEKQSLETQNQELENQIDDLNDKIKILSETVTQKVQVETELTAKLEEQQNPIEFPLSGSASMEESTEGNPMLIFTAGTSTMVVATANGTVTSIVDDAEYGHSLTVDHGNGYVTIYRNQGDPMVKQGDNVSQGATLFLIGENNSQLGYQVMKDGTYINPMDVLAISG